MKGLLAISTFGLAVGGLLGKMEIAVKEDPVGYMMIVIPAVACFAIVVSMIDDIRSEYV